MANTKGSSSGLPSHSSPVSSPHPRASSQYFQHLDWADFDQTRSSTPGLPDNLISPAFTPPLTPSVPGTPSHHEHERRLGAEPRSVPVDTSLDDPATTKQPRLVERLPVVECVVRARIPTTSGAEMFLHLYQNDTDNKEHLAIVFGNTIRSRSLDAERPGETEMDRMIRGAYTGRLRPGRMSSRTEDQPRSTSKRTNPPRSSASSLRHVTIPENDAVVDDHGSTSTPGPTTTVAAAAAAAAAAEQPEEPTTSAASVSSPSSSSSLSSISRMTRQAKQESKTSHSATGTEPELADTAPIHQLHLSQQQQQQQQDSSDSVRPATQYDKPPLVRIHSECYTGETAWSARCDCGEQLDEAARLMSLGTTTNNNNNTNIPNPGGVIVYLRQEGRGIGLASKLKAYNLQDLGNDTVEANLLLRHPADARSYGLATSILVDLGLGTDTDTHTDTHTDTDNHNDIHTHTDGRHKAPPGERGSGTGRGRGIRLLTNNPDKVRAVEGPGREVRVVERVAMVPLAWKSGGLKGVQGTEIEKYLETKIGRMGHMLAR